MVIWLNVKTLTASTNWCPTVCFFTRNPLSKYKRNGKLWP